MEALHVLCVMCVICVMCCVCWHGTHSGLQCRGLQVNHVHCFLAALLSGCVEPARPHTPLICPVSRCCHLALLLLQVGIRLNRKPPNISFRSKKTGGIAINRLLPLTHLDEKMVSRILQVRASVCGVLW